MARAPLLVPALAFVGAIACEAHGYFLIALGGAIASALLPRGRIAAAFLIGGVCCGALRGHPPLILSESRVTTIAGTVIGDGGSGPFVFALEDGRVLRASVASTAVAGERLLLRARLVPFDEPRNPGEPSGRAIGAAEGLSGEAIGAVVARRAPDPGDARAWAARLRGALSARLRAVLREPEATVVAGALWGERGTLPATLRDDFQATGTVHVLVTAGLHLGVIAALVLAVLRLAAIPRVPASLIAIVVVGSYAWLTGAHLPAQRAAVMIGVALLARACGARIASWNALSLAALVVAALWPAAATSVSFALSFSCVAAIVLFARPLEHALERFPLPARVREALSLTVATQIGVWPLTAATFGMVAPYAVLANALVVPATGIAMLGGVATLLAAGVPVLAHLCAAVTAFDVDVALGAVQLVASLPGARLTVAPPPAAVIVVYDLIAVASAALLSRAPRLACVLLLAASMSVMATTIRRPDGHLTITMLDVGQGDAIVLRTPRGHTLLIDTGGRLERGPDVGGRSPAEVVGERIVLGYLRRQGVRAISLLVITHPHGDHVGGCFPIVQAIRVDAVLDSGQQYSGRAFVDCVRAAHEHRVPIIFGHDEMRWSSDDGVTLEVLAPSAPLLADTGDDVNENSIVLRVSYVPHNRTRFRALFMGDAGEASEARLLARGVDLQADLLKVGHHGSRYASTAPFLNAVHPTLALISVGRHNTFGHPAPETLDALAMVRARTLRTDRCGAIRVVVDASRVEPLLCR